MNSQDHSPDFWLKLLDRRELLKTLGLAGSVLALSGAHGLAQAMAQTLAAQRTASGEIPRRALGKTGVNVSALCFGGAHWGGMDSDAEAIRVLHEAIDAG